MWIRHIRHVWTASHSCEQDISQIFSLDMCDMSDSHVSRIHMRVSFTCLIHMWRHSTREAQSWHMSCELDIPHMSASRVRCLDMWIRHVKLSSHSRDMSCSHDDMSCSHVSFTGLIHMSRHLTREAQSAHVTYSYVCNTAHSSQVRYDLFTCVTWLNGPRDTTHPYVWHELFGCDVSYVCNTAHSSHVRYALFTFIGKVVFICLVGSVNLVLKFWGNPVKHDFNPVGMKFHRGSHGFQY
jgi:hypothetical protein